MRQRSGEGVVRRNGRPKGCFWSPFLLCPLEQPFGIGDGPNTVSESTVSNTELSELFCPHRVPGRELSEFLSAYYLCDKAISPSFSQNSPSLPQSSVRLSEFSSPKQYSRNSVPPISHGSRTFARTSHVSDWIVGRSTDCKNRCFN